MEFGQGGGTIGRSLESDWVLPDGQRYLSSRHASIDFRSGCYYIVDTSTNGVYVNDAEQPVGRGNPQRLFTGDRIRIGEYEIGVEIDEDEDTRETLANDEHVDPVSKAQRVPPPDPTRADMVAPHEITAVGIEMLISDEVEIGQIQRTHKANAANLRLEEDLPRPKNRAEALARGAPERATPNDASGATLERPEPPPVSAAAHIPLGKPKRKAKAAAAHAPVATPSAARRAEPAPVPTPPAATASAPLDAFFDGAGLPARQLDDTEAEQLLHCLGQLLREVVLGINDNLHLRAEQKNVLRVPTTTIQPQNNNPLKFSAGIEEALNNLLFRESAEYLSPVDAVRETFADIKQHQQHMLAGMRAAVADYIARLDPDELERKVASGKSGVLASATNRLKYWDIFKDLYQVVAQRQPGQFPQQFIEELARAYELEASRAAPAAASPRQAKLG
jgi:type VI secretion system FHA domain protein